MSSSTSLASLAAGAGAAVFLFAYALLTPDAGYAREPTPSRGGTPQETPVVAPIRRPALEPKDELAALEAIHIALSEVGDGSTYTWHSLSGRVRGVVQPTQAFRDRRGLVCRHVVVVLAAGDYARRTEGVACRDGRGIWSLDG